MEAYIVSMTDFNMYRAAVDAAAIFSESDRFGNITYVNDQFCNISGYSAEELVGQNHRILNSGLHPSVFFVDMWKRISSGLVWKGEICNRKKDGSLYWVQSTIIPMYDTTNQCILKYVSIRFDVTEKRRLLESLQWQAEHDQLTGLANRFLLSKRLDQAIIAADRKEIILAVAILDLDGFKQINDCYGHEAGDLLLVEVSKRLKSIMRVEDTIARLGGDEFVLVFLARDSSFLEGTMQRLLDSLSAIYYVSNTGVNVTASIGVTLYPKDSEDAETLLRHADQVMYSAKQSGRNQFYLFDVPKEKKEKSIFDLISRVRNALRNDELLLYYQPKINLRNGEVVGFEALLRWQNPACGLILPKAFLPIIENTDLIVEIGDWVIDQALHQIGQWASQGNRWSVSVNIAAFHFQKENFVMSIRSALDRHPSVLPELLDIEITESVLLEGLSNVTKCLVECHDMGVTFSLDDFGTGYSSLRYLKQLPTQSIKIDQSFIHQILYNEDSLVLTESIISLAKFFSRNVVAEGVESVRQCLLLKQLGCDYAQGYCFAEPMPAENVIGWAKQFDLDYLSNDAVSEQLLPARKSSAHAPPPYTSGSLRAEQKTDNS